MEHVYHSSLDQQIFMVKTGEALVTATIEEIVSLYWNAYHYGETDEVPSYVWWYDPDFGGVRQAGLHFNGRQVLISRNLSRPEYPDEVLAEGELTGIDLVATGDLRHPFQVVR